MKPGAPAVAIIGGGPAGLMAAERLSAAGCAVTVYDRMPSLARKLLIAGRGGLNLTHSEELEAFGARYGAASAWMRPKLAAFAPADLVAWAEGLGEPTFVGSSGRVFPKAMKASPLLRAWLARLRAQHVTIRTRMTWLGWDDAGRLMFRDVEGETRTVEADAVVLALGGASWPKLGSRGEWAGLLESRGVAVTPFAPANMGVNIEWSEVFRERFAGAAVKSAAFALNGVASRGDAVVTRYGLEGGAIYPLTQSAVGSAALGVDLRPDMTGVQLADRLARGGAGQSTTTMLRKAGLSPLAIGLMREGFGKDLPRDAGALAAVVKAVTLKLAGVQGLERAISSAGGVALEAVDDGLMLKAMPGVFVAGEMLDWSAPTGGYLLQGCFATGVAAAAGVAAYLGTRQ